MNLMVLGLFRTLISPQIPLLIIVRTDVGAELSDSGDRREIIPIRLVGLRFSTKESECIYSVNRVRMATLM